ncbi:SRPBCC family protein [Petropleomorpha daqingensis]|uniref:Putative membrane protein n=1 Tax=Petropleomorpha daqingensis TaxID=2026353 RepID=A0A853CCN0_9ACTN|nr:SRPBCC family protein [Petropleomorpha daqingensis]NYJ05775.1 putative membrane protein [Petropleomorpha daqingensis]
MRRVQKSSCVSVVVDAPVDDVWRVIADVRRTGEWSHECRSGEWLDGADAAAPGVRFRGRNRARWWRWTRTCRIVVADPPSELVWRTVPTRLIPDSTEWRIRLAPEGGGTRITQSFEVVRAPRLLDPVYALLIPDHRDRDARLTDDLRRIGAVAAGRGVPL